MKTSIEEITNCNRIETVSTAKYIVNVVPCNFSPSLFRSGLGMGRVFAFVPPNASGRFPFHSNVCWQKINVQQSRTEKSLWEVPCWTIWWQGNERVSYCPYSPRPDIDNKVDSNGPAVTSFWPSAVVGIVAYWYYLIMISLSEPAERLTMIVGSRLTILETACCRTFCSSKHSTLMREDMAMNIRRIGKNAADCIER